MRGRGSFDPAALQAQLAPFEQQRPVGGPALLSYFDFYQLDLAASLPGLQHQIGWVASGEYRIAAQAFVHPSPRGVALMLHGYYDHVGLFGHLLELLLGERLSVLTFDFPGHGLSTGARATIPSFDDYVAAVIDVRRAAHPLLPAPNYYFAQSMGGAITMEYLLRFGSEVCDGTFLFAPLVRPYAWRINRWVYEVARRTIKQRKRIITENAENPEFLTLMHRDPLAPDVLPVQWVTAMVNWMRSFEARSTLPLELKIVQGEADRTVDWRYNLNLLESRADTEVLRIPDARHHLVNESLPIRQQMFRWISERLDNGPRDAG